MPRKPAHLEMIGGKGPRQRVWERIRARRGAEFELLDVVVGDECTATARDYLIGLERAGYLRISRPGAPRQRKHWSLARDIGAEAPRVRRDGTPVTAGLAQEQMWRTLRMLNGDTNARELAAHASTPAIAVSPLAAGDYLRNLCRASYVECTAAGKGLGRGRGGTGVQGRYRLITNTGPRPPMVCRADSIYDPNLGCTVWIKPVTEEDAIYGR